MCGGVYVSVCMCVTERRGMRVEGRGISADDGGKMQDTTGDTTESYWISQPHFLCQVYESQVMLIMDSDCVQLSSLVCRQTLRGLVLVHLLVCVQLFPRACYVCVTGSLFVLVLVHC